MTIRAGVIRLRSMVRAARRRAAVLGAAFAISLALPAASAGSAPFDDPATALRDYVAAEDPAYGYRLVDSSSEDGYTTHLLRMTSQRWRAPGEALPTRWRHWLVVIVPDRRLRGCGRAGDRGRLRSRAARVRRRRDQVRRAAGGPVGDRGRDPDAGALPADRVPRRRRAAQGGRAGRVQLGQGDRDRRLLVGGVSADDQGGGAGDGHDPGLRAGGRPGRDRAVRGRSAHRSAVPPPGSPRSSTRGSRRSPRW